MPPDAALTDAEVNELIVEHQMTHCTCMPNVVLHDGVPQPAHFPCCEVYAMLVRRWN